MTFALNDPCTRCHHGRQEHGAGEAKTGGTCCSVVTYRTAEGMEVSCACRRFTLRDEADKPDPFVMFTTSTPFRLFKRPLP